LKTLVTGGAGYIGGAVARQLLARGHAVTVYDNLEHGKRSSVPAAAEFIQGQVADAAALDRVFTGRKFDAVLHFAALIEAGESMRSPELYFRNNTAATTVLLECMVRHGIKHFVFSSTAAVYGNPVSVPIDENAATVPTNTYGESKLLVERMLPWFASAHGLRSAILRYFNVAGAIDGHGEAHEPESHLIPQILDVAAGRRESIAIFGDDYPTADGTCIRDYIHVSDIGDAHLLALDALTGGITSDAPLVFNLGNGNGFSVHEVIAAARKVTGHAIPAVVKPRRAGDPARLVASSDKIRRELGWTPEFPLLEQIIESAWKWHQSLSGNKTS
jgi:UDP-glucose 4-epimerase